MGELVVDIDANGLYSVTRAFGIAAAFGLDDGCSCVRCEYRQYVRGLVTVDGRRQRHLLYDARTDRLVPMTESGWTEDVRRNEVSGSVLRYGYRRDRNLPHSYYSPNESGCDFHGTDSPGLIRLAPGSVVRANFRFEGRIIDAPTGRIVTARRWRVDIETTLPAQ